MQVMVSGINLVHCHRNFDAGPEDVEIIDYH
jgi:hypothetical protein